MPVGILAGISILMFIFIWWWFPRHWRKGVAADMAEVDEARRHRDAAIIERATQRGIEGAAYGQEDGDSKEVAKPKLTYVPPVAGY
ncbi:hypothetical protein PMZ80_006336 [Knufia obscura]|uniref:Uncharacterized protein n=2 Tax=Knufia TaxID=430999 RepID=A0AAN8EE57_9EURO|nr:hypothetical protein PMZ80_006336 [Knufia obscura]KAK5953519.1 hypothetical protein OHC33_005463 [Knufia fluminis]